MEFLNTLTRDQQNFHTNTDISGTSVTNYYVMVNAVSPSWHNAIRCNTTLPAAGPVTFFMDLDNDGIMNEANDGGNHSVNFLRWVSLAAYLDWAAIRPMTEFEYEKTCRGPKYPVLGEYVWGTASIHSSVYTVSSAGLPNETITNMGTNTGNAFYQGTRGSNFVIRCGIFAASALNSSRQETGSGYYGCMELSGSVYEQAVAVSFPAGRSYTGLNGDGELNSSGHATTDYWPGINDNSNVFASNQAYDPGSGIGVTNTAGICNVGGYANSNSIDDLRLSDRYNRGWSANSFSSPYGGRGCRTAD